MFCSEGARLAVRRVVEQIAEVVQVEVRRLVLQAAKSGRLPKRVLVPGLRKRQRDKRERGAQHRRFKCEQVGIGSKVASIYDVRIVERGGGVMEKRT